MVRCGNPRKGLPHGIQVPSGILPFVGQVGPHPLKGPLLTLRPVDRSLLGRGRERRGLLPFVHHGRIPQDDLKPLHSMCADSGDPPEMVPSDPSLQRRVGEHDINPVVLLALGCLAGGARGTYVRPSREGQRCHHI